MLAPLQLPLHVRPAWRPRPQRSSAVGGRFAVPLLACVARRAVGPCAEGCGLACRGGSDPDRPKVNQDAGYVIQQEDGQLQAVVLDGHGKQGHLVSGAFRAVLLELLTSRPLPEAFLQGDESLRTLPGARASGAACIAALAARGAT